MRARSFDYTRQLYSVSKTNANLGNSVRDSGNWATTLIGNPISDASVWGSAVNYIAGNSVSLAGAFYLCLLGNINQLLRCDERTAVGTLPTNATYWTLIYKPCSRGGPPIWNTTLQPLMSLGNWFIKLTPCRCITAQKRTCFSPGSRLGRAVVMGLQLQGTVSNLPYPASVFFGINSVAGEVYAFTCMEMELMVYGERRFFVSGNLQLIPGQTDDVGNFSNSTQLILYGYYSVASVLLQVHSIRGQFIASPPQTTLPAEPRFWLAFTVPTQSATSFLAAFSPR